MATEGASASSHTTPPSDQDAPSWEGDRMFNIYIYDYCIKRGFQKTAFELMHEAGIPPQSHPPINAKQGLLFEWWSVFWVLFTAKSSGQGPEDAMLYTQHQAASQNANQKGNRGAVGHQRYVNGVRPPTQNGPQPNGVVPQAPQQPPSSMTNGAPSAVPFPGNMPHTNGVPGTSAGPPGGAPPPPPGTAPQLGHGQRPVPPQQRGMNGAQFQSPTMAHSPPNTQGAPQQGAPLGGGIGPVGTSTPLTQMNNHRTMPPPNGPGPMGNPQHTPQPAYQQLGGQMGGRPPSNPGSPASAITARSPSLSHRQPLEMLNAELNRIPPPILARLKQDLGLGDKETGACTPDEKQQLVTLFRRPGIKPPSMAGPGPSAGPSSQPGPSPLQHATGLRTPQMQHNVPHQGQPQHPQQQGQNQQQRGAKRNSTSPGQEPEQLPRNESSPPDRKRVRRSPGGEQSQQQQQQQPPMAPMYQPQQQGGPHMQPNGLMRGPMQMQPPFPGAPPMAGMTGGMMGHGMGTPQMNPMNAGMMGGPPPGGAMNSAQIDQYRQQMSALHKQPHMQPMHPGGNVASPSASGAPGQGDGPNQQRQGMQYMPAGVPPGGRMGQNKPMSGMHPPPSPGMNAKQPGGPGKIEAMDGIIPNGHLDRSPQNAGAGPGPSQQQQHPQHPSQGPPPQQGGPPPSGTPAPPTPTASGMTAPSPSAMLGTPSMAHPQPPPPPAPSAPSDGLDAVVDFGPMDFGVSDFASGGLDTSMFGETSLNFERDFAAWFDPENANGP